MAVRVFKYTVTDDEIASVSIPQAGVQGEHNATKLEFEMDSSLTRKLDALSGEGKVFCYHFDRYDGTGGKNSTEPIEFTPGVDKSFTHLIEQWQTKYGGTIQVFFVITLTDEKNHTEMELYSYSVKLMLKALPEAAEVDDENYDTIVTLATVAKKYSEIAIEAANRAKEAEEETKKAKEETENAKAALECGTIWVFDGGDAEGNVDLDGDGVTETNTVDIKFLVDGEMLSDSANAVQNKVIKEYIDSLIKRLKTDAKLDAHPVGSYYWSSDPTDPSELFGGSWEKIEGRFLLAASATYKVGEKGGEARHLLTIDEMPSHNHDKLYINLDKTYEISYENHLYSGDGTSATIGINGETPIYTSTKGNGISHNNMPPYIVAYCWKRIS